jgi:hypothetical protein
MEFQALSTLVASICKRLPGRRVILFGSSSLLASFPDADPVEIGAAVTIDADFFIEPDDHSTRMSLSGEFGEDNQHHLAKEVSQLDHEPACTAECSSVLREIQTLVIKETR